MLEFYSSGKILLTGEYLVLHGAKALAFPLNLGQHLKISPNNSTCINWHTFEKNTCVFQSSFRFSDFEIIQTTDAHKSAFIKKILQACKQLNTNAFQNFTGFDATASIEFNMNWGLGTSSTLIHNLAQFAQVDAHKLNQKISAGSGYDIVCAAQKTPIIYQKSENTYRIEKVVFNPKFIQHLHLVYLNKKMATENNVKAFLRNTKPINDNIQKISKITQQVIIEKTLCGFINLLKEHEKIIANTIQAPPVQKRLFADFDGVVKSLGAWGGDFVLAASPWDALKQTHFFNNKGFQTVIPFKDLVL